MRHFTVVRRLTMCSGVNDQNPPAPAYYASSRPDMRQFLPSGYTRVLEVGCGEGSFARHLSGYRELWGIEPNTQAALRAAGAGYRVLNCVFEEAVAQLPDRYFDLVVCNDVIEHMADHDRFFSSIKAKISAGGVLMGSVPNMRNYRALFSLLVMKDWPYTDFGVLDRTHQRWFTEKSFRRALIAHGFEVEVYRGIGSLLGNRSSATAVAKSLVVVAAIVGTLGYYRDIRYLQFAFRAQWRGSETAAF
jgi:SAM-dependent methyltransferase